MDSIRLDSKLGVNPRLIQVQCRICGETKDDGIALLGASNSKVQCSKCKTWNVGGCSVDSDRRTHRCSNPGCGHVEHSRYPGQKVELAPAEKIISRGVCSDCQAHMKVGVVLIEVDEEKTTDPSNPYRAGGFAVVKDEAIERMLGEGELLDSVLKLRVCYMPIDAWDSVGLRNVGTV